MDCEAAGGLEEGSVSTRSGQLSYESLRPLDSNGEYSRVSEESLSTGSPSNSSKSSASVGDVKEYRNYVVDAKYLKPILFKKRMENKSDVLVTSGNSRSKVPGARQGGAGATAEVDLDGETSECGDSDTEDNTERFNETKRNIMTVARKKEKKAVAFDYLQFQKALKIKRQMYELERLEAILLNGNVKEIPQHSTEKEIDLEFAKIYGPVDVKHPAYPAIREAFRAQQMASHKEMINKERELKRCLAESPSMSGLNRFRAARTNQKIRIKLEAELLKLPEATMDMNPFSSPFKLDFFVLPRPVHSITAYQIRPKEAEDLIEFNLKHNELPLEGYNAALHDVGCSFPTKVVGDYKRGDYLTGTNQSRKQFSEDLLNLKTKLSEYFPFGVESKVFFNDYRQQYGLEPDKKILGKYSDDEAPFKLSDVFYPLKLGSDQRIILFPGDLEGSLGDPSEILLRFWNRVRHMLEQEKFVKIDELQETYKRFYGESVNPLNWGFESIQDFIDYVCKMFPDKTVDVKIVTEEEKTAADENQNSNGNEENSDGGDSTSFSNLPPLDFEFEDDGTWFEIVDPLPGNFMLNNFRFM